MLELIASLLLATAGLLALASGAEALVLGASWLARLLRISPAVVGLTIVAFATSVPELCVSLIAVEQGSPNIAVGNVFGSNVFNTLMVIGVGAWLVGKKGNSQGMGIHPRIRRQELPLCLGLSLLCTVGLFCALLMAPTQAFLWLTGAALVLGLIAFLARQVHVARQEEASNSDELETETGPALTGAFVAGLAAVLVALKPDLFPLEFSTKSNVIWTSLLAVATLSSIRGFTPDEANPTGGKLLPSALLAIGLLALIAGSNLLVVGAQGSAEILGVSDAVVALVGIAIGTSAPELATTVAAIRRNDADMAVGNAIGSNLFNLMAVLGGSVLFNGAVNQTTALSELNARLPYDALAATAAVLIVWIAASRAPHRLGKKTGIFMIAGWFAYLTSMAWEPAIQASVTLP